MVRLGFKRSDYKVEPGLYAVGNPAPDSPVLVSANYKLSFDRLRQELKGIAAWILVLDTKGVNVWCAAGKGAFGTDEIVRRVQVTGLEKVVSHRTLIVPQLGAPGVAAHKVREQIGFRVVFGPVRAADISAFLAAGMKATPQMRKVHFNLADRLAVAPVEIVQGIRYVWLPAVVLFLLSGINRHGYDSTIALIYGSRAVLMLLISLLCGGLLVPFLLPWLPGRAFAVKGAVTGAVIICGIALAGWMPIGGTGDKLDAAVWFLTLPAISSFAAMNYTGASTFTSLSGVLKEMRYAVPLQITVGSIGFALWIAARFFH
jgi:acetyl-CoA decarbonylase/synthase complex subunit gamma